MLSYVLTMSTRCCETCATPSMLRWSEENMSPLDSDAWIAASCSAVSFCVICCLYFGISSMRMSPFSILSNSSSSSTPKAPPPPALAARVPRPSSASSVFAAVPPSPGSSSSSEKWTRAVASTLPPRPSRREALASLSSSASRPVACSRLPVSDRYKSVTVSTRWRRSDLFAHSHCSARRVLAICTALLYSSPAPVRDAPSRATMPMVWISATRHERFASSCTVPSSDTLSATSSAFAGAPAAASLHTRQSTYGSGLLLRLNRSALVPSFRTDTCSSSRQPRRHTPIHSRTRSSRSSMWDRRPVIVCVVRWGRVGRVHSGPTRRLAARGSAALAMAETEAEPPEPLTAVEAEEERLRAENELLRAENAALRHQKGRGADIPPRPHTTDPHSGQREQDPSSDPPAGGSLDAIIKWREQRGRSARSVTEDSSDFGPPVLRARSWLAKTPLSNKPNPVSPSSAAPPACASFNSPVSCTPLGHRCGAPPAAARRSPDARAWAHSGARGLAMKNGRSSTSRRRTPLCTQSAAWASAGST